VPRSRFARECARLPGPAHRPGRTGRCPGFGRADDDAIAAVRRP